jgi:sugar/nucleoside kinase (ribokinase family)
MNKGDTMALHPTCDLVCVGNYTKDTIITPAGERLVDGGAVNYAAHAAVRLGKKTAVITHLSEEDRRVIDSLAAAGVACFPRFTPHSTSISLVYPTADPDSRTISVTHAADPILPAELEQVSAQWIIFGTTLRGEVGLDVIRYAKASGARVGLDVQGFVRVLRGQALTYEPWIEMTNILSRVDVLKSDAVEAEFLTGASDIEEAARFYAARGPKEIVLTHRDGLLVFAGGEFHHRSFYPQSLQGRSGRGDTCLGAYVAARMSQEPRGAATTAAAVTSLKMERPCPYDRGEAELQAFLHRWYAKELEAE